MSAFSRPPGGQPPARKPQKPILSSKTTAAPKTPAAPKQPPPNARQRAAAAPTTPPAANAPTAYAYVRQLSQRSTTTTLYEAPSHAWMKFGSWSTALFCFGYGSYTITFYTHPPEGLAWWVGPSYSVIAVAFVLVGTAFLMRTSGIVNTIRALPTRGGAAAQSSARPRLDLEVTVKSTVPFMPPRKMVVPYTDVAMKSRIVVPAEYLRPSEQLDRKREGERAREEKRKYEMTHLLTAPFRHAFQGAKSAMGGIRQLFTGSGFGTLKVGETSYKLDVTNAWMLDDGRALDRLVKVVGVDDTVDSKWARIYQ
ncbi:uncharacterized protein DNG_03873 [Cephalotrichum gorgonifer]|uniref:Uncharacterized protein n=1 Tax=Cephalotrichum gorgonifer TaxID=2041049 RepID=A0AAE8SU15_9PEZI|nr:uncharacterized protein DNG_03873 [Cephalotrichum gorgonifer]